MSKKNGLEVPPDFWSELSDGEKESMAKAMDEANKEFSNYDEWKEMDDEFFSNLRERFGKGEDEIGPRIWKSYQNKMIPMQLMVIPAGRKHSEGENGEKISVQWYHTIVEDLQNGECNGEYSLISEAELTEKYNIKFNNQ
tara:strand:- start:106 stop:525 length:420 start_codon:yes stop_codon:yes gene_type:complete